MTIHEIPNIEHCTIRTVGDPVIAYRVNSDEGWYIHVNNGVEDTVNVWKTAVILGVDYDFSTVVIVAEADLPPDAEIWSVRNNTETE